MIQPRRQLDLAQKALGTHRGCKVRVEDLESNDPVVLHVLGEENRGHSAPSKFPVNCIRLGERRAHSFDGRIHYGNVGLEGQLASSSPTLQSVLLRQ